MNSLEKLAFKLMHAEMFVVLLIGYLCFSGAILISQRTFDSADPGMMDTLWDGLKAAALLLPVWGWFRILGFGLIKRITNPQFKPGTRLFNFVNWYILLSIPLPVILKGFWPDMPEQVQESAKVLFAVGWIYTTYFLSRNLKLAEKQDEVYLLDYALDIVWFWIFPIGIWFLQPRINRLEENNLR